MKGKPYILLQAKKCYGT